MNLSESKIVVIDDTRADVESLLALLNRVGTPYNYYFEDGDMNNLPTSPLKDRRIIFLDFVLGTDGSPEATKISTLITVLKRVLHKDNGPYIIMAWTAHNGANGNGNLLPGFKRALFAENDLPKPFAIIDLDKASAMTNIDTIEDRITRELSGSNVFELLLKWEVSGDRAMGDTLRELTNLSAQEVPASVRTLDEYSNRLQQAVERHMYQFSRVISGEKAQAGAGTLIDAQLSLTGVFHDYLERNIRQATYSFQSLIRKIRSRSTPVYNYKERAKMNSYFLVAQCSDTKIKPGNIYKRSDVINSTLRRNTIELPKHTFFEKSKYQARTTNPIEGQKIQELNNRMVPILFEVSPECDFVQDKWKGVKFISGILYPDRFQVGTDTESYLKNKGKSESLFKVLIEYNGEPYHLILNANYPVVIPHRLMPQPTPLLCARKELLTDIQHWYARHSSRPGKTEFS